MFFLRCLTLNAQNIYFMHIYQHTLLFIVFFLFTVIISMQKLYDVCILYFIEISIACSTNNVTFVNHSKSYISPILPLYMKIRQYRHNDIFMYDRISVYFICGIKRGTNKLDSDRIRFVLVFNPFLYPLFKRLFIYYYTHECVHYCFLTG